MLGIRRRTTEKPRAPAVTPGTPGTAKNTISGRAVHATFQNHRNSGITRRTGGIRRRTPQCRRRTPRGMRRDRNGIRGTREPEENECGRQKNSKNFLRKVNSKNENFEISKNFRNFVVKKVRIFFSIDYNFLSFQYFFMKLFLKERP